MAFLTELCRGNDTQEYGVSIMVAVEIVATAVMAVVGGNGCCHHVGVAGIIIPFIPHAPLPPPLHLVLNAKPTCNSVYRMYCALNYIYEN